MSAASGKIVKLQAGDETIVEVPREIAVMCKTVDNQLKDLGDALDIVPLPNVTGPVLTKVLEFVKHYYENPVPGEEEPATTAEDDNKPKKPKKSAELTDFDKAYVGSVNYDTLFALMLAANYLEMKKLLEVCAKHVANLIKDKDAAGIRALFNLKPAFTPEEEAQLREQIEKIE